MTENQIDRVSTTCALKLPLDVYEKLKLDAEENQRALSRHVAYIILNYFRNINNEGQVYRNTEAPKS